MTTAYTATKNVVRNLMPDSIWQMIRGIKANYELLAYAPSRFPLYNLMSLIGGLRRVHKHIECGHTQREIIEIMDEILSIPKSASGIVVEAGCWKGGSSAKLSLACSIAGRELLIFDSFEGIPSNKEDHDKNIYGDETEFPEGSYSGSLDDVRGAIERFGNLDCCRFKKGWFDETMVGFSEPIVVAFLDVDLESSMRTCLIHLYPLMQPGGVIFSHDGHLPLIIKLLKDREFWINEVGVTEVPRIDGLGTKKLIRIHKI